MSQERDSDLALTDLLYAARLFVHAPDAFGGICLRGFGPARDALMAQILQALPGDLPVHKIPNNVDQDRLLGGIDLAATLSAGKPVRRTGLLEQAKGGLAILPMAERMDANVAAHVAQAVDRGAVSVILLDDGLDSDETPPSVLTERLAFHSDCSVVRDLEQIRNADLASGAGQAKVRAPTKKQRRLLAATAASFGIHSARPLVLAERCTVLLAKLEQQDRIEDKDLEQAVRLVLAPRAIQFPQLEEAPPPEQQPDHNDRENGDGTEDKSRDDIPLEDMLLEAAAAAIPKHILDQINGTARLSGKGQGGRSGQKQKSTKRGRPQGTRLGVPGNGRRLALIETLRTAAPWQTIRKNERPDADPNRIHIRKSDLRVHHYDERRESLTIFAVDASGSSALARLAEAKGAVELMLAEAYVKRSQVALIAFRKESAELLLPPTRSLTRARRALSALPGGGGTPLAAGLVAARQLAEAAIKRGQTPTIALLTDGKGNIMLDGTANRKAAMEEAGQVAKTVAAQGLNSIVIDISPRPRTEAATLAENLRGRYLPLPVAQSAAMVEAIESVGKEAA